jgi:hypothetical protein
MPSQREQYGDTVHLFIGTGRSPCKITLIPFTFINNSMIILRGLIWFFIFESVSFSAAIPKLFYTQLRLCANLRVLCASSYRGSDPSPKIPVNVLFSRNIIKSCFLGPSEAEGPQQKTYAILDQDSDLRVMVYLGYKDSYHYPYKGFSYKSGFIVTMNIQSRSITNPIVFLICSGMQGPSDMGVWFPRDRVLVLD